jgi:hypothetical protein
MLTNKNFRVSITILLTHPLQKKFITGIINIHTFKFAAFSLFNPCPLRMKRVEHYLEVKEGELKNNTLFRRARDSVDFLSSTIHAWLTQNVNAPATGPLCMRPSALVTRIHRTYFMDLLVNTTRGEVMCSNTTAVSVQPNHKRFA